MALSSIIIIAKMLEYIILERMQPALLESNFPLYLQTAYQSGVSCGDAIFATQEAALKLLRERGKVFLSLFDLEKAFDTIEKEVLLRCLYKKGICGRAWKIVKSWYSNAMAAVEINNTVSQLFDQDRGVRQGSVLSLTLFLIVMDEMLREMSTSGNGVSIAGLYLGSAAHADDIRSLSQSTSATENQAINLINLSTKYGLKINANKTEVVALSRTNHPSTYMFTIAKHQVETKKEAKCLGYWWKFNLGADKSVEANIERGRKSFFATGAIGAYQGSLNPLSSRSIFLTCVIPVLLYGSENWILNDQSIAKLETFQSQMGKRMLKIPNFYNNLLSRVVLQLPSIRVQILIRKLRFLAHLLSSNEQTLGPISFRTLAMCNVDDISLVQQCRWLEKFFPVTA